MDGGRKRTTPTADLVAETIWKMQDASKREKEIKEGKVTIDGLESTKRLIRQSISLGLVSLEQLQMKVKELWPDKPIRSYVSRIIDAASSVKVPGVIELKQEVSLRLHVPLDDKPSSVEHREQIATERGCDCGGTGLVSRRIPHRSYGSGGYDASYRCTCPVGEALKAIGDTHRSVTDWDRMYGPQTFLKFSEG